MTGPFLPPGPLLPPTPPPRNSWGDLVTLGVAVAAGSGFLLYAVRAPVGRSIGFGISIGLIAVVIAWTGRRMAFERRPTAPLATRRQESARRWEFDGSAALLHAGPEADRERARVRLRALVVVLLRRREIEFPSSQARILLGERSFDILAPATTDLFRRPTKPPSPKEAQELMRSVVALINADRLATRTYHQDLRQEQEGIAR